MVFSLFTSIFLISVKKLKKERKKNCRNKSRFIHENISCTEREMFYNWRLNKSNWSNSKYFISNQWFLQMFFRSTCIPFILQVLFHKTILEITCNFLFIYLYFFYKTGSGKICLLIYEIYYKLHNQKLH